MEERKTWCRLCWDIFGEDHYVRGHAFGIEFDIPEFCPVGVFRKKHVWKHRSGGEGFCIETAQECQGCGAFKDYIKTEHMVSVRPQGITWRYGDSAPKRYRAHHLLLHWRIKMWRQKDESFKRALRQRESDDGRPGLTKAEQEKMLSQGRCPRCGESSASHFGIESKSNYCGSCGYPLLARVDV